MPYMVGQQLEHLFCYCAGFHNFFQPALSGSPYRGTSQLYRVMGVAHCASFTRTASKKDQE